MTSPISINHRKSILAVFLILGNFYSASSQCLYSGKKHVRFAKDSISSFDSQDAVKYAVFPSIKKSQSCFELRMYIYPSLTYITPVLIIKSSGDSLICTHYDYRMQKNDIKGYVNIGPAPNSLGNIYLCTRVRVAKKITPQLAELINNSHLFTILSWKAYLHKHKNFKLQQVLDGSRAIIEVKLNHCFRNFEMGDIAALNKKNKYSENIRKIGELFKAP